MILKLIFRHAVHLAEQIVESADVLIERRVLLDRVQLVEQSVLQVLGLEPLLDGLLKVAPAVERALSVTSYQASDPL